MCGISGLASKGDLSVQETISRMNLSLAHHGPDGGETYVQKNIGLGHRRLAIIDLETGKQPLPNEDQTIWVTFNGEIYNYQELRQTLVSLGHQFKTKSDTETVVHAYEQWQENCVLHLRGMFAFAIADFKKERLFLARDHLGIKPLYYVDTPRVFAFASEIQALRKIPDLNLSLDLEAIDQYLFLGYIPDPDSIYKQIKKLPPAHSLSVSFDGGTTGPRRYWNLHFSPNYKLTESGWVDCLDKMLRETVTSHLVSDVPFGAFLSGGVDSSLTVAYMAQILKTPVKTFSIGFEEDEFNELPFASFVAGKWATEHHCEIVKPDALGILPRLVQHYGEPFGDSSAIPTYYVCQMARHHVPMVLSGDGADEAFGGYKTYLNWISCVEGKGVGLARRLGRWAASMVWPRLHPRRVDLNTWFHIMTYFHFSPDQRSKLWRREFHGIFNNKIPVFEEAFSQSLNYENISKVQSIDIKTYLPFDILRKVDRVSMMHGLEGRSAKVS